MPCCSSLPDPFALLARDLAPLYGEREGRAVATVVAEDVFGLSQTDCAVGKGSLLTEADKELLRQITARLLRGEPVQYVTGKARVCGRTFAVGKGCLIPRPETEDLVRLALSLIKARGGRPKLLDIGTGSGCIALTLAMERPDACSVGWDASEEALRWARRNGQRLGGKATFELRDILAPCCDPRLWDAIISNPPYVCQSEAQSMQANVLDWEPPSALFVPDGDAMLFVRAIAAYASQSLLSGGWLALEINEGKAEETLAVLRAHGFGAASTERDRFGKQRIAYCQKT